MLELRPGCEHCRTPLPPSSTQAYICSHECTFCESCANGTFQNVCPNCGGGFERRPVRPQSSLLRFPASIVEIHKPVDLESHSKLLLKYKGTPPALR